MSATRGSAPGLRAFAKLCGAGNDFIVFDASDGEGDPSSAHIVKLCDRRYGVGADGLMVLRPGAGGVAFEVNFYNADGSGGMLCGNGARCAIERARILGLARPGETVRFRFAGADYSGESLSEGKARFDMDPRFRMDEPREIRVGGLSIRGRFVDVGSLHFVMDIAGIVDGSGRRAFGDIDAVPMESLGAAVRRHPDLGPLGVNANFTELRGGRLYVRTFERGVEAETLACGTGSASSALVRWREGQALPPVVVVPRSGDELVVDFDADGPVPSRLSLTGPAFQVFTGRLGP
ncbi:MAG: diaminopimelate epimerase [Spirochaetae bacterium HGW-Spirochaetae-3]|jgi:diaminopimelate epimerase|nr:MAG: diaminopimelate epimerase [Spirochaetae bacterium HGW-Spirochaetae-3]